MERKADKIAVFYVEREITKLFINFELLMYVFKLDGNDHRYYMMFIDDDNSIFSISFHWNHRSTTSFDCSEGSLPSSLYKVKGTPRRISRLEPKYFQWILNWCQENDYTRTELRSAKKIGARRSESSRDFRALFGANSWWNFLPTKIPCLVYRYPSRDDASFGNRWALYWIIGMQSAHAKPFVPKKTWILAICAN